MIWFRRNTLSRFNADRILALVLGAAAFVVAAVVLVLVVFVAMEAEPALVDLGVARFFTDSWWRPTAGTGAGFGTSALLVGSLLVTVGAMAIAGPLGLLSALFVAFYAPAGWVARTCRRLLELLNGVPSVVFGFWGLVALVPWINRWRPPGQSLLAGALVLSVMILPTVALTADAALRRVPADHLRAAASLGLGRWATVRNIALPVAGRAIVAGLALGAARAVGETMAVVMVCGNIVQVPGGPLDPVRTVTANIALEMGYATATHRSALFVTGLLLIALIAGAILSVEWMRGKERHV